MSDSQIRIITTKNPAHEAASEEEKRINRKVRKKRNLYKGRIEYALLCGEEKTLDYTTKDAKNTKES